MGLGDRIRAFFSRKSNPALTELEDFAAGRKGLEGFIEPRTPTSPTTLLLVDRYGEHMRAPVREPEDAVAFCERLAIPVYDAKVIGYPKRMREYDKRSKQAAADSLEDDIAELERRLTETPDP
ncbi:MAG: oxidoreductase [Actinobacteria bacterium]|nr:oxidoreductase [Actinomycetota bacterium]